MKKARRNFLYQEKELDIDSTLNLTPAELKKGVHRYKEWHWGIEPFRVIDVDDKDMPRLLIGIGHLIRFHVRAPRNATHPRRKRDAIIEFSEKASKDSYVAFDPDHPGERIYLVVAASALPALRQRFWVENTIQPIPLAKLAQYAGGRHGRRSSVYPNIKVKYAGQLTNLVYRTHKKGDEPAPSYYIHEMGEMTHYLPALAFDRQGRPWLAGGNYTCPNPGITD